jgi:hypothetical protein
MTTSTAADRTRRASTIMGTRSPSALSSASDARHYNSHRPHRSLHQRPPVDDTPRPSGAAIHVLRRDRLGGLLHEYQQVA